MLRFDSCGEAYHALAIRPFSDLSECQQFSSGGARRLDRDREQALAFIVVACDAVVGADHLGL